MVTAPLIFALPVSVIGTNFSTEWANYKQRITDRASLLHKPDALGSLEARLR